MTREGRKQKWSQVNGRKGIKCWSLERWVCQSQEDGAECRTAAWLFRQELYHIDAQTLALDSWLEEVWDHSYGKVPESSLPEVSLVTLSPERSQLQQILRGPRALHGLYILYILPSCLSSLQLWISSFLILHSVWQGIISKHTHTSMCIYIYLYIHLHLTILKSFRQQ